MQQNVFLLDASIFSSRETAYFIWATVALIAIQFSRSLRREFSTVLKSLMTWVIVRIWLLMVSYMGVVVFVFYQFGWWDISLLKDTIIWFLFTGSVAAFRVVEREKESQFFSKLLKDNIRVGIFIEYFLGEYTFYLWLELLAIPVGLLVASMIWVSKQRAEHRFAGNFLNLLVTNAGLAIAAYVFWSALQRWQDFLHIHKIFELLLAPLLTISVVPFLYWLSLYIIYEKYLVVAHRAIVSKDLHSYATWLAIRAFGLDIDGLQRWSRSLWTIDLNDKQALRASVEMIKVQQRLEKEPPEVDINSGWSPYAAKKFLRTINIETGHYKPTFEDEWMALSPLIYIGEGFQSNTLTFYVIGNAQAANELRLVISVFSIAGNKEAVEKLINTAIILFKEATGCSLPKRALQAIRLHQNILSDHAGNSFSVEIENWPANRERGYNMTFKIARKL